MQISNPETSQYSLDDHKAAANRRRYAQEGITLIDRVLLENPADLTSENEKELRNARKDLEKDMAGLGLTLTNTGEGV